MLKILAIGNSFSQDATALLQLLNKDLFVRNAYIGGCSLERHVAEITEQRASYEYQENGENSVGGYLTLQEIITAEQWNYITVQQVSGLSGIFESYLPHLNILLDFIRQNTSATVVLHQTWAYEKNSDHGDFPKYGSNQLQMWQAIEGTSRKISKQFSLPVICVGEFIQQLRSTPQFDIHRGGISLNRDGFHLSFGYGRLAAALVWNAFFTGTTPAVLQQAKPSTNVATIACELAKFVAIRPKSTKIPKT